VNRARLVESSRLAAIQRGAQRGLSLVEVMISLAITSMLLTAIAAAFQSSSAMIENNDQFFRATQSARVALNQILTEVRRCDSVQVSSTQVDIIRPNETRPVNEKVRSYKYDAANKRLVLFFRYADDTLSAEYPLAENIISSTPFSFDMGVDANNAACVSRLSVALEVKVKNNDIRLSGSAAPRRSLSYK
jgi:prepilin-type N-terminal cleavage/methylation domain-containing protein